MLSHFYNRLKDLEFTRNLLAGLTPVVVGIVLGAALLLIPGALQNVGAWLACALTLLLLVRWCWQPAIVLVLGAIAGIFGFVR
ncbi:hypothetical protein BH11GEM2_BH11GEM2_18210 [soil metagenome]